MKSLSIIVAGRNDGYGDTGLTPYNSYAVDTYCFRMKTTILHNIRLLKQRKVDVQYVIVDWSPIDGKTLDQDPYIKELIEIFGSSIKHVVVHPDSVSERGWNSGNFYEYYAKNIGIRNADGDYVIITNPDNLFSEELCDSIAFTMRGEAKNEYYRPYSRKDVRRDLDNNIEILAEGLSFLDAPGTAASGDFVMALKSILIEKGQGYDETESTHENKQQTTLDGSFLINLYLAGVHPVCLAGSVLHLDHAKPHLKDYIAMRSYQNNKNWGMLKVEIRYYK